MTQRLENDLIAIQSAMKQLHQILTQMLKLNEQLVLHSEIFDAQETITKLHGSLALLARQIYHALPETYTRRY